MTMTSPTPVIRTEAGSEVEWRQLGRYLWAGRRDGRPVGTVEQGRRFVRTDADGEIVGAYRTLAEAQAATDRRAQQADRQHRGPVHHLVATAIVLGGGVAMGAGALAVLATV